MIFNHQLLFLHVPKTGGSSVRHYLLEVLPTPVFCSMPEDHQADLPPRATRIPGVAHESLGEARSILAARGQRLDRLRLIIACARNPYELEVSRYAFLRQELNSYNHGAEQALALTGDFELFAVVSRPHGQRPIDSYFVLDGLVPPSLRVVRLEDAANELSSALRKVGIEADGPALSHRNRSHHGAFNEYLHASRRAGRVREIQVAVRRRPLSAPEARPFI